MSEVKRFPGQPVLSQIVDVIPSSIIYAANRKHKSNRYRYDKIGNLVEDKQEKLKGVFWNVYGKISKIEKPDLNQTIVYDYDATGNRIKKRVTTNGTTGSTWYIRDAQGNVMAVYSGTTPAITESHIYGSSRLGMYNWSTSSREYELTNHLGNVLATISDTKVPVSADGTNIDYYEAGVLTAQDYYAFGGLMNGRKGSEVSKYGFNGKENDNEVKGEGNQIDYGMRISDPRLGGRFLSVDPLTKGYPELIPYQFASNRPIEGIDLDGEEFLSFHKSMYRMEYRVTSTNFNTIVQTVYENIPAAIQNPESKSFKYVSGGPVTDMGRDYTRAELSNILYNSDRYFKNGPKFYGLSDGEQDPEPTASTSGMSGLAVNQAKSNAANIAAGALGEEGAGVIANQFNKKIWRALGEEARLREGFYAATSLVNNQIKNNMIGSKSLAEGAGKSALINFLADGNLPADRGNDFALQVAYEGVQQMKLGNIGIQDKTIGGIQTLLNQYKKDGGDNRYDKLKTFLNQGK